MHRCVFKDSTGDISPIKCFLIWRCRTLAQYNKFMTTSSLVISTCLVSLNTEALPWTLRSICLFSCNRTLGRPGEILGLPHSTVLVEHWCCPQYRWFYLFQNVTSALSRSLLCWDTLDLRSAIDSPACCILLLDLNLCTIRRGEEHSCSWTTFTSCWNDFLLGLVGATSNFISL